MTTNTANVFLVTSNTHARTQATHARKEQEEEIYHLAVVEKCCLPVVFCFVCFFANGSTSIIIYRQFCIQSFLGEYVPSALIVIWPARRTYNRDVEKQ